MNSERIKMLEQFVAEDPSDPFNRYALGLELAKSDRIRAKEIFDELIRSNPGYVPAYYQTALLYIELSLLDEAAIILKNGITEALKQNDRKAASELSSLLNETT